MAGECASDYQEGGKRFQFKWRLTILRRYYYLRCQTALWKKHLCPFLMEQLGYALLFALFHTFSENKKSS